MFIPLSLWAVHRTMESGRWRYGMLVGLFLWLQFLSCVYYGVFLSLTLAFFVPLLFTFKGHVPFRRFAPPLLCGRASGGAVHVALRHAVRRCAADPRGTAARRDHAVQRAAGKLFRDEQPESLLGLDVGTLRGAGTSSFPGLIALLLAIPALVHPRRRLVALYVVTAFVVVQLSFGLNGWLYTLLLGHITALQGFGPWHDSASSSAVRLRSSPGSAFRRCSRVSRWRPLRAARVHRHGDRSDARRVLEPQHSVVVRCRCQACGGLPGAEGCRGPGSSSNSRCRISTTCQAGTRTSRRGRSGTGDRC